jgi:hypothetical protein
MGRHDLARRFVQRQRSPIVAQSLPELQHLLRGSLSQCLHIGKRLQEPLEIRHHCARLSLLQHDLTHPDRIRIAGLPPGKLAAML